MSDEVDRMRKNLTAHESLVMLCRDVTSQMDGLMRALRDAVADVDEADDDGCEWRVGPATEPRVPGQRLVTVMCGQAEQARLEAAVVEAALAWVRLPAYRSFTKDEDARITIWRAAEALLALLTSRSEGDTMAEYHTTEQARLEAAVVEAAVARERARVCVGSGNTWTRYYAAFDAEEAAVRALIAYREASNE